MSDELVQIRLNGAVERRRWRSLSEWFGAPSDDPGEFAPGADLPPLLDRRSFLQLVGAGAALAGLGGCERDLPDKILPYSIRPKEVTPGVPAFYATSMVLDGFATGLVVESHEGRPTKIEGNPDHPSSLGGTGLFQQASVLQLYDPERASSVRRGTSASSWESLSAHLRAPRSDGGRGLRLLLEPSSSPLLHELLARLRARYPGLKVTFWSPCEPRACLDGARLAFGRPLQPRFDLSSADVILSLDADLLGSMPDCLRHARQWSARRHLEQPGDPLNRLYAVEPMVSDTGSVADHRLRRRLSEIGRVAAAIAVELPGLDGAVKSALRSLAAASSADERRWARVVARDLVRHAGSSLVAVGPRLPAAVHALGYAMNAALGNFDRTVALAAPLLPDGDQDLAALARELHADAVDTLLIAEANPVYAAPAELDFRGALARAPHSVYLGLYENETAQSCGWSAPSLHYLESWGDARAYDGTLSLIQPLIRPLHGGRQLEELLAVLADLSHTEPYVNLRDSLERRGVDAAGFEAGLQRGLIGGPADTVRASLSWRSVTADLSSLPPPGGGLELQLALSPTVHDGRFANNPWLQETPQPITKLTWDNAALLSLATATRLSLEEEDLIEITIGGRRARSAVMIVAGHADDCVTLLLGYGRSGAEALAATAGFDVYPLRTSDRPYSIPGAQLKRLGRYRLAQTQQHWSQYGRELALTTTLAAQRADPSALTRDLKGPLPSLMSGVDQVGPQWAMTIDLSVCTGCSACTLACYTENNNLVVGKREVLNRREMDWLRIDTYFEGDPHDPGVVHQPMMCQHCEKAPCEYVCPVNATVHSTDGLNEMIYNRCVGTRFCSNNCPYKVRRFNWFDWTERVDANRGLVQLQKNPDVTVRERGVMEKCSYCVQRIREADIRASIERREIRPGEVVTACQQACPTRAIQFGSLSHEDSEMVRWRKQERSYAVLHDQNTSPRTMYLARVNNPNPELEP